jgi:hypothetical protein
MKKFTFLFFCTFFVLCSSQTSLKAFVFASPTEGVSSSQNQVKLGKTIHKPTFKERAELWMVKKVFKGKVPPAGDSGSGTKFNWYTVVGMILSLVAFTATATVGILLLLSLLGTVFSIIGLVKVRKSPDIYKGKGFAIVGLVIGIICLLVVFGILAAG